MNDDLSKRANLLGVREERLAGPATLDGVQWVTAPLVLREDSTDPGFWLFDGEASVVEHAYTVRDSFGEFTETISKGAFDKTLAGNPLVSLVYMHDMATVMAQTRSRGNLELWAGPNLNTHARLDKTDVDVQRVAPKMQRGDANSMSFGFRVMDQTWNEDYTDRQIHEVNLNGGDVSIIATGHGANPAASGQLRIARDMMTMAVDETAPDLCSAIDATLDEALDAAMAGDLATVTALLTAADVTMDSMMAAMGLADPDEMDGGGDGYSMNSAPDPEEVRAYLERLQRTRDRQRIAVV